MQTMQDDVVMPYTTCNDKRRDLLGRVRGLNFELEFKHIRQRKQKTADENYWSGRFGHQTINISKPSKNLEIV